MFSLVLFVFCGLFGVSLSQWHLASNAFCALYGTTCGYNNATHISNSTANATECAWKTQNATVPLLTCYFYHLGVAWANKDTDDAARVLHCGHASGTTPCDPGNPTAQTGAQFCGAAGLWGQACSTWPNVNLTEADCTSNYTAAYNAEKLCYTYNAAARISAGAPFNVDSGNLCVSASGIAGGVCNEHGHTTPVPTTASPTTGQPSFAERVIVGTGISGNYAFKNFIALNVPVAMGVCYQAPEAAAPHLPQGNLISCNVTGVNATTQNIVHTRYFTTTASNIPTSESDIYLNCGTTNTSGNIRTKIVDVAQGNCSASTNANNYVLASICVIAAAGNPTEATACTDAVCDCETQGTCPIRKITVPVLTGACVSNGAWNVVAGNLYSTMTCTNTSLTFNTYGHSLCPGAALLASVTANSTHNCAFLQDADVEVAGSDIPFKVYLKYECGSCHVNGANTQDCSTPAPTGNANHITAYLSILATAIATILFA